MLAEFRTLDNDAPRDMVRVTALIAHLLRSQFIHMDDRGAPAMLETLRRKRLFDLVAAYFDVAGYRLVLRDNEGWAGIIPDSERISPPRMRLDESIALLVMRRLWEEAVQDGEMEDHGNVVLTFNSAYAAYQEIVGVNRRATLAPHEFRQLLDALGRRAILRMGPYDDEAQDYELTIRALVATVAGDEFVAALDGLVHTGTAIEDVDQSEEEAQRA
ncbi:DUF4194 domain-containing protein [Sphingobium yanoikuyae]|uniref:DUF4194 domain-containing protein n=1 Tax=Sphingobium yanoikuyae TaxID=13690 RepID=UPI0028A8A7B9|nr:DUF4194 domain-containing protein [Sphingobium yanoikuyae]